MPTKKKDKKEDKLKKFVEEKLAKHKRWLSQHKLPNLGDNDANPEYIAEYHEHLGVFDILDGVKALM